MATVDRYDGDNLVRGGKILGTNQAIVRLREGIDAGFVRTTTTVLRGFQRLDILAHQQYGDGRLWWVIAAASNIGWWLQAPPGTRLVVPVDLNEVEAVL